VTATGANAFVQFTVPYLISVRGWLEGSATLVLVVAFGAMPLARLSYAPVSQLLGDYGALIAGHVLFLVYLGLLGGTVEGSWVPVAMGLCLSEASALVFTGGPLQILDSTSRRDLGTASGLFFASNFLAWLVAIALYGFLASSRGLPVAVWAAVVLTIAGSLLCVAVIPRNRVVREPLSLRELRAQLRSPSVRTLIGLMLISAFSFGLMFGSFATFASAMYGPGTMSLIATGFYAARLPASLAAGVLADRFGLQRPLVAVFTLTAIALALAAVVGDLPTLFLALVVLGAQQGAVQVLGMTLVGSDITTSAQHLAYAPIFGAAEFGVALSILAGLFLRAAFHDISPTFAFFALVYALSALAVLVTWKPRLRSRPP
jgi:predicted MFS family arabinose efflux permease